MDKDQQSPFDKIPKLPADFKITTGGTVVFNARVAKNLYPYMSSFTTLLAALARPSSVVEA